MPTVTFAEKALHFYMGLREPNNIQNGISVIYPHKSKEVRDHLKLFLNTFFSDTRKRVFVLGINPGRFGSGITGIPFTDPVALERFCGINNTFLKRREMSSEFMYTFIDEWGGADAFYHDFFLSAVSPIGFVRYGANYNYYDDKELLRITKPFIVHTLQQQCSFGARDTVILLGIGKNQKKFIELNSEFGFFKNVFALEHPRFIMQYRRKSLKDYLKLKNRKSCRTI